MKGPSTLVASILAASTFALSSPGDRDAAFYPSANEGSASTMRKQTEACSPDKGKFAPRFDGLRFIETLITAHR